MKSIVRLCESRYSELLDLAQHAWSIAVCAMHGMPIPASWGNAVEKGLREHGINVDKLPYVVPDATLGNEECEPTEETVGNYTRWHELFGTPESAARTMAGKCCDCLECVIVDTCEYGEGEGCPLENYDALLEWLRGDAE